MGDWQVISERDLDRANKSGNYIRAYCHFHGSDKQRSLSINRESGFGRCHACGEQVLVRELNPEAASNIERGHERISQGEIRLLDVKRVAQARAHQDSPRAIDQWKQEELSLLRQLKGSMEARLGDDRARAYIEGRGLSLDTAVSMGIGYIPDVPLTGKYDLLKRWRDHIIFPVYSPSEGLQFSGRCLKYWEPGMDEDEHKKLLEEKGIRRYLKTHAGGWFNYQALDTYIHVVFVEGAFDALSLIEAGMLNTIAVIGTALTVDWLPKQIEFVTLSLDGDDSGREKAEKMRSDIYIKGYDVRVSCPPTDGMGKDWSERYRLHGREGLAAILPLEGTYCCICPREVANISPEDGKSYCEEHWQIA